MQLDRLPPFLGDWFCLLLLNLKEEGEYRDIRESDMVESVTHDEIQIDSSAALMAVVNLNSNSPTENTSKVEDVEMVSDSENTE